jgi:enoyl-CoA hydratase/carnithine racemase
MQITGEFIDADRAYDWGIVNEVVSTERLLPRALEIAAKIAACPEKEVRRYVDLSRRTEGMPMETSLALELVAVDAFRAGL